MEQAIEYISDMPYFPEKYTFQDKYTIVERVGFSDQTGATYFAKPVRGDEWVLELVMRFDKLEGKNSTLLLEASILVEADKQNKHRFFGQLYDCGSYLEKYGYYCRFFRGGPSLPQICDFMREKRANGAKFTSATVGRFAENLYEIVGFLHSQDLVIAALDKEMFHFDGASRTLFLNDLTTVRHEPHKEISLLVNWSGHEYMPVNWYDKHSIKRNMEVEAVFYMVLEFALGKLPWSGLSQEEVARKKADFFAENKTPEALEDLPEAYHIFWQIVKSISLSSEPYQDLKPILMQCAVIYRDVGGCKDLDEDLDFERQPTPDELPNFVLEKNPVEEKENKEQ